MHVAVTRFIFFVAALAQDMNLIAARALANLLLPSYLRPADPGSGADPRTPHQHQASPFLTSGPWIFLSDLRI